MTAGRRAAQSSMATAAMPLVDLDRWLADRAARRPAAADIHMLDGYVTAIVAGPVSLDPPIGSVRCSASTPIHSITAAHPSSPPSLPSQCGTTRSATRSRPRPISSGPCIGASPTAMSTRAPGAEASTPPCSCGCPPGARFSTSATSTTACSCRSSCTVSMITAARCSDRPERGAKQGIPAHRPCGHSSRRRGHAAILDAHPVPALRRRRGLLAPLTVDLQVAAPESPPSFFLRCRYPGARLFRACDTVFH
jgi:hypothetical protein